MPSRLPLARSAAALPLTVALAVFTALAVLGISLTPAHASGVPICSSAPVEAAPNFPPAQLDHTEGPLTTPLQATLTGWKPGTQVSFHLDMADPRTGALRVLTPYVLGAPNPADGLYIPTGVVASDGTIISASFQAPVIVCDDSSTTPEVFFDSRLAGAKLYVVAVGDHGQVSAPATFTYLASLQGKIDGLSPEFHDAPVGSTLIVSVSGWEPNEVITLTLSDQILKDPYNNNLPPFATTLPITVTTDSQGAFSTTFAIPATLPWGHDAVLSATGVGPHFGALTWEAEFVLLPATAPTFRVGSEIVTPGSRVTVTGDYWNPGEAVTLEYCRDGLHDGDQYAWPHCIHGSEQELGTAIVDATGHLSQQVTIPANARLGIITIEPRIAQAPRLGARGVAVRIVSHPPTWTELHPRWTAALAVGGVLLMLLTPVGLVAVLSRRRDSSPAEAMAD
ncbi:MAG TPA: hypothetical protein VF807_10015 [Ktedonobacterales bacterium]